VAAVVLLADILVAEEEVPVALAELQDQATIQPAAARAAAAA
jgi:hypothetical protein